MSLNIESVISNDKVVKTFDHEKKVLAEEVMHKNPEAKILPTRPVPPKDISIDDMVPIYHKTCERMAFFYTHIPETREMMTSVRARTLNGGLIEPCSPMICGSCGEMIEGPRMMYVSKADLARAV